MKENVVIVDGQIYKVMMQNEPCLLSEVTDTTRLELEVDYDNEKFICHIMEPSARTQYLFNEGTLYLNIFVEEKSGERSLNMRSGLSLRNHRNRRQCYRTVQVTQGTIEIPFDNIGPYSESGAFSRNLQWKFYAAADYGDPYVSEGYEDISFGIGRGFTEDGYGRDNFRPYRMSEVTRVIVYNRY